MAIIYTVTVNFKRSYVIFSLIINKSHEKIKTNNEFDRIAWAYIDL